MSWLEQNFAKWDKRFIDIAQSVATWSKDPGTKVGAVLVLDRRIIATGYNGFPAGIDDYEGRYNDRETKLKLTVHAEVNAILNAAKSGAKTEGSTLFVTFAPCVNCCTALIQAGISRVVCPKAEDAPERWRANFMAGEELLREAGIELCHHSL